MSSWYCSEVDYSEASESDGAPIFDAVQRLRSGAMILPSSVSQPAGDEGDEIDSLANASKASEAERREAEATKVAEEVARAALEMVVAIVAQPAVNQVLKGDELELLVVTFAEERILSTAASVCKPWATLARLLVDSWWQTLHEFVQVSETAASSTRGPGLSFHHPPSASSLTVEGGDLPSPSLAQFRIFRTLTSGARREDKGYTHASLFRTSISGRLEIVGDELLAKWEETVQVRAVVHVEEGGHGGGPPMSAMMQMLRPVRLTSHGLEWEGPVRFAADRDYLVRVAGWGAWSRVATPLASGDAWG